MQIFGVSWRLLGEQRSFNGNDVDTGVLACSKPSDSGERYEVKKAMKSRGRLGTSPPPSLFLFCAPFSLPLSERLEQATRVLHNFAFFVQEFL